MQSLYQLEADARTLFDVGVEAVQAPALLEAHSALVEDALGKRDTAHVIGVGKAAMAMAGALEAQFPEVGFMGEVTVPHSYPETFPDVLPAPYQIAVRAAGHPTPDLASSRAGQAALEWAEALGPGDLLLVLISGGGSALWTTPRAGLELADLAETTQRLLASGVPIQTLNAVRKRLSAVAGGRLAAAAHPSRVVALVISDVVGDDFAAIASGPTVGDAAVLEVDPTWRLPSAVRDALADPASAPLAPGDRHLERTSTHLIGSIRVALAAAKATAESMGYAVEIASATMDGEARDVGSNHARVLRSGPPRVVLWGGETTVTVTGDGQGGRNQEAALAAAIELAESERPAVLLCGGTDGIDGPTDAAGGVVTPRTVSRGQSLGLRAGEFLNRNDACTFLSATDGLVITGPTHTNVMDLHIGIVA
ncbi:MAG: DUF4147 domain-containing protein [Bacteroidota bacterium]